MFLDLAYLALPEKLASYVGFTLEEGETIC